MKLLLEEDDHFQGKGPPLFKGLLFSSKRDPRLYKRFDDFLEPKDKSVKIKEKREK